MLTFRDKKNENSDQNSHTNSIDMGMREGDKFLIMKNNPDDNSQIEDDLPLLLTTETSTNGTGTEAGSSTAVGDEERWLELELEMLERMSIRTQTVEEILAEKNDFPLDDDDLLYTGPTIPSFAMEDGCSSAAATGIGAHLPPMGRYGAVPTEMPNSYQLDSPLIIQREDEISQQISSFSTDQGIPTAICIGLNLLAVGTSHGHCILFERGGIHTIIYSVHPGNTFGSISCLDFSSDQSRLCIGFSMGALIIFQCKGTGKILFKSEDIIQPGRGIIHVKYISIYSLLIVDNGGNVYEFHERKLNNQKENVRCLFTGSKGEVTNLSFVHTDEGIEMLILATFYQALLLSVKKRGATVGQIRLHGSPKFPPLIDWRERKMKLTTHTIVRDLRICIAREYEVRIYQVRQRVGGDLLFPLVQTLRLSCPIINLKWIDDWALLALSSENGIEQLQLFELQPMTTAKEEQRKLLNINNTQVSLNPSAVEEIATSVKLIYNSVDFKGLATGQNVSQAMQNLANFVSFQSFVRHSSEYRIHLLGQNGIFTASLLEQSEQLELLIKRNEFASAMLFAIDICTGQIRDRTKRGSFRPKAFREIPTLVEQLLDQTLDGLESGRIDELISHYKRNFHVIIRACVITSHFDLLYNSVYSRIQNDCLCRSIFLELLEEFVLEDELDKPPPTLVNDYLNYLLTEGQLPQFEQSIIKLPVECMDLHQVMSACREHQLFDGICYVFNNAMRDYISPLAEMFEYMQRFVHKELLSDLEVAQGNKLLLYLSSCLAGRAYPYGELADEHLAKTVPLETYKFLVQLRPRFTIAASPSPSFTEDGSAGSFIPSNPKIQSTISSNLELRRFPQLNLLLHFDAQQFLNVISTCADAPVFAKSEGRLKRLVDVLVSKCIEDGNNDENLPNEFGPLLITFVSGLLQKGAIPKDIFLFTQLINSILKRSFLNLRSQKMAEQGIVELLRILPEIDLDEVLKFAQKLPHVHICAFIFTMRKEYLNLLEYCLQDPVEPLNIFPIITDLLSSLRDLDKQAELGHFVHRKLHQLSTLHAKQTAQMVLGNFPELLVECRFQPKNLPLPLLQQCFQMRREQGHRTLTGNDEEQDELLFDYFFEGTVQQFINRIENSSNVKLDMELVDQLRYWLPLGSLNDHCLNISMQAPNNLLLECSIILLVARGHIQRAFEHLFHEGIAKQQQEGVNFDNSNSPKKRMERCIGILLELASIHPLEARQGNWMPKLFRHLLNTIGEMSAENGTDSENRILHSQLLRPDSQLSRVFTAMIEQQQEVGEHDHNNALQMVSLISEFFSHPYFQTVPFHAFQNILRQMLLWCEIRTIMQKCTRDCIGWELTERWQKVAWKKSHFAISSYSSIHHSPQNQLSSSSSSTPNASITFLDPFLQGCQQYCLECGQRISKSFFLFPCGHCIHLECIDDTRKRCRCEQIPAFRPNNKHNKFEKEDHFQSKLSNKNNSTEEERRMFSAIFRLLERDFKLRTGPPPPKVLERKSNNK